MLPPTLSDCRSTLDGPLTTYPVHAGTVIYLALEDDYRRLQERLFRMFGVEGTDTLHFATCAKQLGAGLYEQLTRFVSEHKDTRLIIIDTLQKIREAGGESSVMPMTMKSLVS